MSKPSVLVARAVFPEVVARLREHFEVEDNQIGGTFAIDDIEQLAPVPGQQNPPPLPAKLPLQKLSHVPVAVCNQYNKLVFHRIFTF